MGLQNQNQDASLQDICSSIWKQKWLILAVTLIGLFLSLAYLRVAEPVYEAQAFVTPPLFSQIEALNEGRSFSKRAPLNPITLTKVYQTYITALTSEDAKLHFFHDIYYPSLTEKQQRPSESLIYKSYSNALIIKKDIFSVPNGLEKYTIAARYNNPELASEWIKQYLFIAEKKAHEEMADFVNTQNKSLVNYNQWMIAALQTKEQPAKQVSLQTAVNYAKATNNSYEIANANVQDTRQDVIPEAANINLQNSIMSVEEQASKNLQKELEIESKIYSGIDLSTAKFQMYRMDGEIQTTLVWPNQKLIILLGLLGGLMLGSLMAIVRNYIRVR